MNQPQDLNINSAECIKSASHFGYTAYQNICNGTAYQVDWGGVDWLILFGATAIVIAFTMMMAGMAVMIFRD